LATSKIIRILFGALLLAVFVFCILLFGTTRLSAATSLAVSASVSGEPVETNPAPTASLMSSPDAADTLPPTTEPTPEPTSDLPGIDVASWEFTLANGQNSVADYTPELTEIENGQYFDTRAAEALEDFIAAARAEGLTVYLSSAYRTSRLRNTSMKTRSRDMARPSPRPSFRPPVPASTSWASRRT
jgi:LAS superfamily LD-carboxypeptidase LdcB